MTLSNTAARKRATLIAAALLAAAALVACGGHSSTRDVLPGTPENPGSSVDAFFAAVSALVANSPDDTEPAPIDATAVTTPENTEPQPLG